jgi:hypothetical protein
VFDGKWFFVSTILRESSAMVNSPGWYPETITWEYNRETMERGNILDIDGSGDALKQHFRVVADFYRYGKRKQDDEG